MWSRTTGFVPSCDDACLFPDFSAIRQAIARLGHVPAGDHMKRTLSFVVLSASLVLMMPFALEAQTPQQRAQQEQLQRQQEQMRQQQEAQRQAQMRAQQEAQQRAQQEQMRQQQEAQRQAQ